MHLFSVKYVSVHMYGYKGGLCLETSFEIKNGIFRILFSCTQYFFFNIQWNSTENRKISNHKSLDD